MKRKLMITFFGLFMFFMFFCNVEAACYKKCTYPLSDDGKCPYVTACNSGGSVSCEKVQDTFCTSAKKVNCGNVTDIPRKIPELTSFFVTVIQIMVPIILIIMGSIDLFKGITAQKEEEIKKGQQMFIKRLIVGVLIFFIVVIAKFAISLVADAASNGNIVECVDCFVSNECK